MKLKATHSRGFTLLEVLISMIIIAGAILVLSNSWSGSFMKIRKATLNNNVATLLERKMVETEAKYKDKFNDIPENETGDFGTENPMYTWELKSKELLVPDLTPLIVGKEGGADEMLITMIKQLTEYLNKTVKEVTVSVFVKTPRRTLQYSATTYIIDYSQSLGLSAGAAGGGTGGTGGSSGSSGGSGGTGGGTGGGN